MHHAPASPARGLLASLARGGAAVALAALLSGCFGLGLRVRDGGNEPDAVVTPDVNTNTEAGPPVDATPTCSQPSQTYCSRGRAGCYDLSEDLDNCGTCGNACPTQGSNFISNIRCRAGACRIDACAMNRANCDGDISNGCETITATSVENCGSCGNRCPAITPEMHLSSSSCVMGSCVFACAMGYADCDRDPSNGCEVRTATDTRNCGVCGFACTSAQNTAPTCTNGMCGSDCAPGYGNCDGDLGNGCEVSLDTAGNCGACHSVATPSACTGGRFCVATRAGTMFSASCQSSCPAGQTMCDDRCVDMMTDVAACGSCTTRCSLPAGAMNARSVCTMGTCRVECAAGFADCDGNSANGCEAPLGTMTNCGMCGDACPSSASCAAGRCVLSCPRTSMQISANCDGMVSNGCEVQNLLTNADHCGRCGNACFRDMGTMPSCTNGECRFACIGTFRNCDGMTANGCETDTATSAMHCGRCGAPCAMGQRCVAGACMAM